MIGVWIYTKWRTFFCNSFSFQFDNQENIYIAALDPSGDWIRISKSVHKSDLQELEKKMKQLQLAMQEVEFKQVQYYGDPQ